MSSIVPPVTPTAGVLLAVAEERLAAAGTTSPAAEAAWLLEETLGLDSGRLPLALHAPADPAAAARLETMVARRVAGEPLQYVLGWAPFGLLRLAVGPGVLVPRPETELLAERAAARLRAVPGRSVNGRSVNGQARPVAVDLCTGSGAIACYLAREVPAARVLATELDPAAAHWARRNTAETTVELYVGDLDTPLPGTLTGQVDVLVTNPPYVPAGTLAGLPADVRDHEPRAALDGGPDGLDVLRRVVRVAGHWLRPGGWALLEIGEEQGPVMHDLLTGAGFGSVRVLQDLTGRDRMMEAQWTTS